MMLAEIAVSQLLRGMVVAAGTMLLLGLGFAVVLLIASIKLKVVVDEKIRQVHEALPKIDCGACGYAGCASYAKAVAANPELLGKCAPGGPSTAEAIAGILNLQVRGGGPPLRPIVHCRAHRGDRTFYAAYTGIPLCTAANAQTYVQACKFGCLGFGDCTRACKFDALHVVDGLATVDYEKCTGCTACSKACPRGLIEMAPFGQANVMTVACSSRESGKATRAMCQVGCIACGLCAKQSELFKVDDNLARVDYSKYAPSEATETAMTKCPTGVIVERGKTARQPRAAGEKPAKASA